MRAWWVLLGVWLSAGSASASTLRYLHSPPESAPAGVDLHLRGQMFGAEEMDRAFVVYRIDGAEWRSLELLREKADEYGATVPGQELDGSRVEYYVQAFDWFGDVVDAFASRRSPHRVKLSGGAGKARPSPPAVESKPASAAPGAGRWMVWQPGGVVNASEAKAALSRPARFDDERVSVASRREQSVSEAPSIVTVLSAEQLEALHVRRLADLMKFIPGFETSRDVQGFWRVAARGRRSDAEILVMLDGRRMNNPYDGRVPWEFSLDQIERVEIVRGPGGALFGAGAFGAVINLVPKTSEGVDATLSAGSFGSYEGSARGALQFGDLAVQAALGASRREGYVKSIRQDAISPGPDVAAGVTDDHRTGFDAMLRAEYRPPEPQATSVSGSLRAWRESRGALVGYLDVVGPGSELLWTSIAGDAGLGLSLGSMRLEARGYADAHFTDRLFSMFPAGYSSGTHVYPDGVRQQTEASLWSVGGELTGELEPMAGHRLSFGAQLERQSLSSFAIRANVVNDAPVAEMVEPPGIVFPQRDPEYSSRLVAGFFVQDSWAPFEPLVLTGGLRVDTVSGFGLQFNPRLALVWRVAEPVVLKFLAARAFRAPTFEESLSIVALSPSLADGQVQGFDKDSPLEPMTVTTVETGLELSDALVGGRGTLRANAFFNLFSNPIEPVDSGSAPRLVNRDAGVRVVGLEGEARYDWSAGGGSTFVNVSWFRAEDLEVAAQTPDFSLLTDLPQLRANWGLTVPLGELATLGVSAQFGSERRNNARTTLEATRRFRIPAYGLFGASITTRPLFERIELQASVFNLSDLAYQDDVPRPDERRMPGLLPREGVHGLVTARVGF